VVTATITDEGVELLRSRIGVPQLYPAAEAAFTATIERFERES
jgi:hypothetical protein